MTRKTKAQREAEEMDALRQRLLDMLRGAHGGYSAVLDGDEDVETPTMLGIETLGRWLGAIRQTWLLPKDAGNEVRGLRDWDMGPIYLHHFDTVDTATEYLYGLGVRA